MKIQWRSLTLYMGGAYLTLAFISLFADLPNKAVNCIALGALFISISELIISISTKSKPEKPMICVEDLATLENKLDVASMYLKKSLDESVKVTMPGHKTLLSVCILDSFAISIIIALPYNNGLSFLEWNKFGTFCTIASLGIIMLSRYVTETSETWTDIDNRKNYIEGVSFYIETVGKNIEQNTEKLSELVATSKKVAQSNPTKGEEKEKRREQNRTAQPIKKKTKKLMRRLGIFKKDKLED